VTRDEALKKAIESLDKVHLTYGFAAEDVTAHARLASVWLAVHDRLPEPAPPSEPVTRTCGHDMLVLSVGAAWVHVGSMDRCDQPPAASDG
jgi:hypothetical protein